MDDESSGLRGGARNFSPNKNYEERSKKKIYICIGLVVLILLILLVVGLYFLLQEPNHPNLKMIPEGKGANKLIDFNHNNYHQWTESIDKGLNVYKEPCKLNCTRRICDFTTKKIKGQPCLVQLEKLAPCTKSNNYGYSKKSPCIFLHLSDTQEWTPVFYDNKTSAHPAAMPKFLLEGIHYLSRAHPEMLKTIWVSCEPILPTTWEEMGAITYIPMQGIPGYFYPEDSVGFQAPLVAIYFEKPQLNKRINVNCRAWAENLLDASENFQLLID